MSAIERDDPRLVFMPEHQVLAANGIVQVLRDRWFSVCPERGLIFWQPDKRRRGQFRGSSPQCNGSDAISRDLNARMYSWARTRFFPLVLLPIDLQDYR